MDFTIFKLPAEKLPLHMQTLWIKNQEVLVFYYSGSNGHLIEGQTAELLNLDVLSCKSVPIGG